jgi:hypothetical protein
LVSYLEGHWKDTANENLYLFAEGRITDNNIRERRCYVPKFPAQKYLGIMEVCS